MLWMRPRSVNLLLPKSQATSRLLTTSEPAESANIVLCRSQWAMIPLMKPILFITDHLQTPTVIPIPMDGASAAPEAWFHKAILMEENRIAFIITIDATIYLKQLTFAIVS